MCKIVMAEIYGKDLLIACDEMFAMRDGKKVILPDVYGTDGKFTVAEAVKAFKSRHRANEADKNRTRTVVPNVVGTDT